MKKIMIVSIALYLCSSCANKADDNSKKEEATIKPKQEQPQKEPTKEEPKDVQTIVKQSDTLVVNQKALVIHDATDKEVKKWRSENEENFGESLSDNLTYIDETNTEAKKKNLTIIRTETNIIVFEKQDGSKITWTRSKNFEGWGAIAFKEDGNPKKINIVDAKAELAKYFGEK
jgi:hypothetical protein